MNEDSYKDISIILFLLTIISLLIVFVTLYSYGYADGKDYVYEKYIIKNKQIYKENK